MKMNAMELSSLILLRNFLFKKWVTKVMNHLAPAMFLLFMNVLRSALP